MYQFKGDDITFVRGSALCALEGKDDAQGKDAVLALMAAVDAQVRRERAVVCPPSRNAPSLSADEPRAVDAR